MPAAKSTSTRTTRATAGRAAAKKGDSPVIKQEKVTKSNASSKKVTVTKSTPKAALKGDVKTRAVKAKQAILVDDEAEEGEESENDGPLDEGELAEEECAEDIGDCSDQESSADEVAPDGASDIFAISSKAEDEEENDQQEEEEEEEVIVVKSPPKAKARKGTYLAMSTGGRKPQPQTRRITPNNPAKKGDTPSTPGAPKQRRTRNAYEEKPDSSQAKSPSPQKNKDQQRELTATPIKRSGKFTPSRTPGLAYRKTPFPDRVVSSPLKRPAAADSSDIESDMIDMSPNKKIKNVSKADEDEDADVSEPPTPVKKPVKKPLPLPRGMASKGTQTARRTGGAPTKSSKAPDSGDVFFTAEPESSEKAQKQRRLFEPLAERVGGLQLGQSNEEQDDDEQEDMQVDAPLDILSAPEDLYVAEEGVVDPILMKTLDGVPPVRYCEPIYGQYQLNTAAFSDAVLKGPFNVNQKALLSLITDAGNGYAVVNPARASPYSVVADPCGSTKGYKCIATKLSSGPPRRLACFTIGLVGSCNVLSAAHLGQSTREIKQIIIFPLRGEWERSVSFFGHLFGESTLSIGTFNAQRVNGLSIKTLVTDPEDGNGVMGVSGLGTTPRRKKAAVSSKSSGQGSSLFEMRDKLTWSAQDTFNIYDARSLFVHNKAPSLHFSFDDIEGLPRLTEELSFRDLAMVLYSASEYKMADRPTGLSLNLYGVILLAKAQ